MPPEYQELEKPERPEPLERKKSPKLEINFDGSLYLRWPDGDPIYVPAEEAPKYLLGNKPRRYKNGGENFGSLIMRMGEGAIKKRNKQKNYDNKLKFICG